MSQDCCLVLAETQQPKKLTRKTRIAIDIPFEVR